MGRWSSRIGIVILLIAAGALFWKWSSTQKWYPTPETKLRIALFQAPASDALNKIKGEFEKQFGVKVEIELLPYADLQSKIEQQFRTDSSNYDVIMVDCILIPAYAFRGNLGKLDPSLWKGSDFRIDDLMPALDDYLSRYPKGGERFGMPFMSNTQMMAYRVDVVAPIAQKLGLKLPGETADSAWTWDQYLKVAEAITSDRQNDKGPYGTSLQARAGAWIIYEWYSVLFAFVRDTAARTTGLPVFSADAAAAMDFYKRVYSAGPKDALTWGHEEETSAMCSALTAMDATSNVELAAQLLKPGCSQGGELRFAYPPTGVSGSASPDMGGYGLLLTAQSKLKDQASQFILWAASPEVHRRIVMEGGSPIRKSEAADSEILAKYPYLKFYPSLIDTSIYRARVPKWLEFQDILSRNLVAVMRNEMDSKAAASEIQTWSDNNLKK
jgi:multiple sugar transport system substrate-binding protein